MTLPQTLKAQSMTKYTGILKYNKQVAASTVILPGTDQKI
jgi:hypothetical protein